MREDLQKLYEKNIVVLKEKNPDLAEKLEACTIDESKYQLIDGDTLFNLKIGNELYYGDDIQKTLKESWNYQRGTFHKFVICYGMGLGYDLSTFLSHPKINKVCQHIVIVEKDLEVLKLCLHVADLDQIYQRFRLHFIYGSNMNEISIKLTEFLFINGETKLFVKAFCEIFTNYAFTNEYYYVEIKRIIHQCFRDNIIMYGNSILDSLEGFKNMLDNIAPTINSPGISKLHDKFRNKTAILVAAGPSLQKNISYLKGIRDKCFIICVDTALKPLLRAGIYPHMVTAIERGLGPINYYLDIDEYLPELRKKTIFAPATILRKEIFDLVVNQYGLKCMAVFRDFAHYKWLGIERGIIKSGKSSANLAFQMLKEMGFEKILLVGQDLAFGENDQTHTEGADHSSEGMKKSGKMKKVLHVKGNYVDRIKTLEVWDSFKRFYETDIKEYIGKVYNCTEGGAYIYGTKISKLKDAIKKHVKPYDVEAVFRKHLKITDEEKDKDILTVKTSYIEALKFVKFAKEKNLEVENIIANFTTLHNTKDKIKNMVLTDARDSALAIGKLKNDIWSHPQFYLFFTHIAQSFNISFETDLHALFSVFRQIHNYWITYIILHRYWSEAMSAFLNCTMKYFAEAIEIFNNNYGEKHGKISIEENLS